MKEKFNLAGILLSLSLIFMACGGGAKQANTPPANNANAAKPSNTGSTTSKKSDKPKTQIKNEKKPEGDSKKAKKVAVPENWVYFYDDVKGYGFSVPEGSTEGSDSYDGIDVFVGATPAPAEVAVFVLAYKDKTLSKEDLFDHAGKFLEGMGEKVTPGKLVSEGQDYSLGELSSVSESGAKSKAKVLVGTDVTDNYIMIVVTDEGKFDAHKDVIDAIWGSFEMWSGGASGES